MTKSQLLQVLLCFVVHIRKKENANSQLEVNENKDIFFSPGSQTPALYPQIPWRSMDPRLRMPYLTFPPWVISCSPWIRYLFICWWLLNIDVQPQPLSWVPDLYIELPAYSTSRLCYLVNISNISWRTLSSRSFTLPKVSKWQSPSCKN